MNKKREFRDVFAKQPAYYLLLDGSIPLSSFQFSKICDVINDVAALTVSIRGSPRISVLGVYYVWKKPCCRFYMQPLKDNFQKLHYALEDMKCLKESNSAVEPIDSEVWKECLRTIVGQYEEFMQGQYVNPLNWPRLQVVILTRQPLDGILQTVREVLPSLKTAFIRKIQVVGIMPDEDILELQDFEEGSRDMEKLNILDSPIASPSKDKPPPDNPFEHLLEIHNFGSDIVYIEKLMKSFLHDMSNDSEHLRIQLKDSKMILLCDMHEIELNPDSIHGNDTFRLASDIGNHQVQVPKLKNNSRKVPVHELEAVGLISTYRTCLNSMRDGSFVISPTTCWKTDWSLLRSNRHLFSALREQLESQGQLLVARSKLYSSPMNENSISCGYFGIYAPSDRNIMFVISLRTRELLLPEHPLGDYEIPADTPAILKKQVANRLKELLEYDECNPVYFSSRLNTQLAMALKNPRPQRSYNRKYPMKDVHRASKWSFPKKLGTSAPHSLPKKPDHYKERDTQGQHHNSANNAPPMKLKNFEEEDTEWQHPNSANNAPPMKLKNFEEEDTEWQHPNSANNAPPMKLKNFEEEDTEWQHPNSASNAPPKKSRNYKDRDMEVKRPDLVGITEQTPFAEQEKAEALIIKTMTSMKDYFNCKSKQE